MSALIALPVYFIPLAMGKIPNLDTIQRTLGILVLGRIAASLYTALSVGIFYLILKRFSYLKGLKINIWFFITVFFMAFCTDVYSISSRGLWQHVPALLINSITLLVLLYSNDNKNLVKWLGVLCGLSFLSRPTNIVYIMAVSLFVFVKYRKQFTGFILTGIPFAIIYFVYNYLMFGSPVVNEYVARGDTSFTTPLWVGLVGYMFSPARSFLFITPPLVLSYYCLVKLFTKRNRDYADSVLQFLGPAFIVMLLVYSMWWCWYGADRFGYGFFTEWVPVLVLLIYEKIFNSNKIGKIVIIVLILYSFYVQFNAVWYRKSRCNEDHNWDLYCLKPGMFSEQEY